MDYLKLIDGFSDVREANKKYLKLNKFKNYANCKAVLDDLFKDIK